jgi:hypothetical protein
MEERVRVRRARSAEGPTGLEDPFASGADDFGGMANVNGEDVPVSGMTLGEIRRRLADRFRIEPGSTMHINGEPVNDEHRVVRTGERVEFLRQAGEKGNRPRLPVSAARDHVIRPAREFALLAKRSDSGRGVA